VHVADARHAAILLAAGASTRLGRPKQRIAIDGVPLLRRTALALLATQPDALVVVLADAASDLRTLLDGIDARIVVAGDAAEGLSASLRAGLAAVPHGCAGALVAVADQPALDAAHLAALCSAWRAAPAIAAASAYAGVLGVPALLPRAWFAELSRLQGDVGARAVLRAHADRVVAVDAPGLAADVDVPDDLARWS